jgi:hypothetical protein
VRRRVEREERRIGADAAYRSTARTLQRLVTHNMLYEAPGSRGGEWERFHVRKIGLAVNRRMRSDFGGSAERIRAASQRRVAAALGLRPSALPTLEQRALAELALVLDSIPDLARWSPSERRGVAAIVRAKAGRSERRYLRLAQRHARLRRALIRLGTAG